MAKKEYGFFDREKVEDAVTMMLNAHAEVEYDTARKYMYYIVEGKQITLEQEVPESKHPFLKYFDANWHQCRGMLGGFGRSDVPHSGNTTNNRLEAAWGLLFDPQHKGKRLDACEDILKELFPDQVAKMTIKRETKLKQTDGVSCGPWFWTFLRAVWVVSRSRRLFQRSNENNSKYRLASMYNVVKL
ncbi:hypothetical protein JG687_00012760 [Phytophthora cactorum]|uniref:Uncharacterized protein n=1 Tax=Phytophthora cactorum TaxID=29920 RepID=A0A8T1U0V6_9STRA|nr:hypothetical protein PC112_g19409 [Phytophthora cactorum]KAG2803726.1 hypothetical protein PC111_g18567 [Phytophthora cactorum]KAG6952811.1 hypothetical protein JG687_00012760 [Phytophthora cactorum]